MEQWASLDGNGVAIMNITAQLKPGDYIITTVRIHKVPYDSEIFAPPVNYVPRLTVVASETFTSLVSFMRDRNLNSPAVLVTEPLYGEIKIATNPTTISGGWETYALYSSNGKQIGTAQFNTSNSSLKLEYIDPKTKETVSAALDYPSSSKSKAVVTVGNVKLSLEFDLDTGITQVVLEEDGVVEGFTVKSIRYGDKLFSLVYGKGELTAVAEWDIEDVVEAWDDIFDDAAEAFGINLTNFLDLFDEPNEELLLKFGSRAQKQAILDKDPAGYQVIGENNLGQGFVLKNFANGSSGLYYQGEIVEIYKKGEPRPTAVYESQLSDGTFEIIYSDGTRAILSADKQTVLYRGPANVLVVERYGVITITKLANGNTVVQFPDGRSFYGKIEESSTTLRITAADGSYVTVWKDSSPGSSKGYMACSPFRDCQLYDGGGKPTWHIDSSGFVTNPADGWNGKNPFNASRAVIRFWSSYDPNAICNAGCGPVSGYVQASSGGWHSGGYIWPDGSWSPLKGLTGPPKHPK